MRLRPPSHLTYANVMATLAMFVALGGTGYAATKIGSKQIADNSVQGKDIKNGTITGKDVKKASLTSGLFAPGQLPRGATGAAGATGPQGAKGETGPPAATAFAAVTSVGQVSFSRGVVSATRTNTGHYNVQFDRSVEGCAPLAVQGYGSPSSGNSTGSPNINASVLASNAPNSVQVFLEDNNGTDQNASFVLGLFC